MRTDSIDFRNRDTIEICSRILNKESDRTSISALRNQCDFTFEDNWIRAHRIPSWEIDGTSDSVRKFDRLRGGRIIAQNPKCSCIP
jgi:hypothetical protein